MALRYRWVPLWAAVAVAVLLLFVATRASTEAQESPKAEASTTPIKTTKTARGMIRPNPPSVLSRPSTTSPDESAAAQRALEKLREQAAAANAKRYRGGGAESTAPVGRPTKLAGASGRVRTQALLTPKNFRNFFAQTASSTLAEPAAAADDREVLYVGNTYQSRSEDGGASWVSAGKYPDGPPDAPVATGDADVVHASSTDTTFSTVLYTNRTRNSAGEARQTNGMVRIFVRRDTISGGVDCTYDIRPGGYQVDMIPDYPHIATSNNFLYLSMNNVQVSTETNAENWVDARTMRFNLSQISNCQPTAFNTFSYSDREVVRGWRMHVPVENATTTMYWGQLDKPSSTVYDPANPPTYRTFRIFSWPESTTTVSQFTRPVSPTNFENPDCKGGTGDFDWLENPASAWDYRGFHMRGATGGGTVEFLWNAGPDSEHTQAHLHGAVFRTSDFALIAEPRVFDNSFCFGLPALGSNRFGEYALSVAFGGDNVANSGASAQGGVTVDDSSSAGYWFPLVETTAFGTHNRSDARFGDYFTVRNNERCPNTWNATNYALLNGNTSSSHVNARYVEFQSSSDPPCPS
jgi:hypothetical protein